MSLSQDEADDLSAGFPGRFRDRLSTGDLRPAISLLTAGEWAHGVSSLLYVLEKNRVSITSRELQDFRDLVETFASGQSGMAAQAATATRWLDSLPVTPSLTEEELVDRLKAMPDRLRGRLPEQQLDVIEVDPEDEAEKAWKDLVYVLVETLHRHQVPVSAEERAEIRQMQDAVRLPPDRLLDLPAD